MPGVIDDDPVERWHRDDDAECRALRNDGRRNVRFSSGNHLNRACRATEPRPFASARMMRQTSSVVKLTSQSIGNCTTAQMTARTRSTQRVSTLLTIKPTTMAAIENRKKEGGAQEPELLRREVEIAHDRVARETDDDLVGEVDEHVEEQEEGDLPCAFGPLDLVLACASSPPVRLVVALPGSGMVASVASGVLPSSRDAAKPSTARGDARILCLRIPLHRDPRPMTPSYSASCSFSASTPCLWRRACAKASIRRRRRRSTRRCSHSFPPQAWC